MPAQQWNMLVVPELGMQVQLPATTPSGHPVDIDEIRLHVQSRHSAEVYFELSRHLLVTATEQYEREKAFVTARLQGRVSPLRATTFGTLPAWTYSFSWADKQRVVVLIERGEHLHRCIYDPEAELNHQILARLQLV